jgi:hypothetical protein
MSFWNLCVRSESPTATASHRLVPPFAACRKVNTFNVFKQQTSLRLRDAGLRSSGLPESRNAQKDGKQSTRNLPVSLNKDAESSLPNDDVSTEPDWDKHIVASQARTIQGRLNPSRPPALNTLRFLLSRLSSFLFGFSFSFSSSRHLKSLIALRIGANNGPNISRKPGQYSLTKSLQTNWHRQLSTCKDRNTCEIFL